MTARPTGRFKRCPKCKALLRRTAELCPHCGTGIPISFPHNPIVAEDALRRLRAVPDIMAPPTPADVVGQYLLVVARERRELYEYLRRVFAREPGIQVVLERRAADRRRASGAPPLDRRRRERRQRAQVDAEIRRFGIAVVRLD